MFIGGWFRWLGRLLFPMWGHQRPAWGRHYARCGHGHGGPRRHRHGRHHWR
jgi:hypothetical protein